MWECIDGANIVILFMVFCCCMTAYEIIRVLVREYRQVQATTTSMKVPANNASICGSLAACNVLHRTTVIKRSCREIFTWLWYDEQRAEFEASVWAMAADPECCLNEADAFRIIASTYEPNSVAAWGDQ